VQLLLVTVTLSDAHVMLRFVAVPFLIYDFVTAPLCVHLKNAQKKTPQQQNICTINNKQLLYYRDLSNNKVVVLPPLVFANLSRLATLIVSYTRLPCVPDQAFGGLKNLRILSLHGNDISVIPETAFTDTTAITHL